MSRWQQSCITGLGEEYNQNFPPVESFAQAKAAARNMQLSIVENSDGGHIPETTGITENELWLSILNEKEEAVIQKPITFWIISFLQQKNMK